jgi:hypothetical protein
MLVQQGLLNFCYPSLHGLLATLFLFMQQSTLHLCAQLCLLLYQNAVATLHGGNCFHADTQGPTGGWRRQPC